MSAGGNVLSVEIGHRHSDAFSLLMYRKRRKVHFWSTWRSLGLKGKCTVRESRSIIHTVRPGLAVSPAWPANRAQVHQQHLASLHGVATWYLYF